MHVVQCAHRNPMKTTGKDRFTCFADFSTIPLFLTLLKVWTCHGVPYPPHGLYQQMTESKKQGRDSPVAPAPLVDRDKLSQVRSDCSQRFDGRRGARTRVVQR
jgi:hypothetical protein